jgi:hypothetical protein
VLLPDEQALVDRYKITPNKLRVLLLLKYFEIEGHFPRRQRDVPQPAVDFVARKQKIPDAILTEYNRCGRTIKFHRAAICKVLGFREGTYFRGTPELPGLVER